LYPLPRPGGAPTVAQSFDALRPRAKRGARKLSPHGSAESNKVPSDNLPRIAGEEGFNAFTPSPRRTRRPPTKPRLNLQFAIACVRQERDRTGRPQRLGERSARTKRGAGGRRLACPFLPQKQGTRRHHKKAGAGIHGSPNVCGCGPSHYGTGCRGWGLLPHSR
jgi:hypothetical protein